MKPDDRMMAAVFLAYILHGGDVGLTIRLAPGSGGVEYHTMEIVTSTSSTKLGIGVGGPPKTFLLTARKGGPWSIHQVPGSRGHVVQRKDAEQIEGNDR